MKLNNKKQTLIQNTKTISNLKFNYLDLEVVKLLKDNTSSLSLDSSKRVDRICQRLNCFLGLQEKKLSLIEFLNKKETSILLSEFVYFNLQGFLPDSISTSAANMSVLKKIILEINIKHNTNITINNNQPFNNNSIINKRIKYFNGWWLKGKSNNISIPLYNYFDKYGEKETDLIFKKIEEVFNSNQSSFLHGVSCFNEFIEFYCVTVEDNIDKEILIKSFLKNYFIKSEKENKELRYSKVRWNHFIDIAHYVFNLSDDLLFKIKVGQKNGFEKNIKISKKGQVKKKLITDIPLEICDEDAIDLLFNKINQDVELINSWANNTIDFFEKEVLKDKELLNSEDYGLTVKELSKKKCGDSFKYKKNELYNEKSIFVKKIAISIAYLLINEHPEITESFLLNCNLINNNGSCLRRTDAGTYLVSYKPRRGVALSEQQVLLNKTSLLLVNKLINGTKTIREHLENNNNNDYKKLFICCNSTDLIPVAPTVLNEREGAMRDTNKSIIDFLTKEKDFCKDEAIKFANKISLTKMRASKGIQIYIKTESTTKMAEALGHKKYRSDLLSHYLPEPILDFFQRRWISIFQKGIICEALKESDFILESSGFKDMDTLNKFLKTHTIRNIPDNSNSIMNSETKDNCISESEVYISVSEDRISALLSIKKAIDLSKNKENVSSKAIYWANFGERLIKEIETNKNHTALRKTVINAKSNINPECFKEIIHVK